MRGAYPYPGCFVQRVRRLLSGKCLRFALGAHNSAKEGTERIERDLTTGG